MLKSERSFARSFIGDTATVQLDEFFRKATGEEPFPFQRSFAEAPVLPRLVHVPTGLGKTAMAVVGWLWRRFGAGDDIRGRTPRRLVYCLPMRVLVEQTRDHAARWVTNLRNAGCLREDVPVYSLMGGEDENDWDLYPEREAILTGTQDMLLSRALNRGYAASRARWPVQFGLLHTDCLWIFDEIQLMGSGLATTAQLEAFRHLLGSQDGHGCRSVWMSATLRPEWLRTADFRDHIDDQGRIDGEAALSLSEADHANERVGNRWNAKKPLARAESTRDDPAAALAAEVRQAHRPGTRTIVVVNTVRRARELFGTLEQPAGAAKAKGRNRKKAAPEESAGTSACGRPRLVLLHSRFRPADREKAVAAALADPSAEGTIIVSTQVIEAGVDVSAATLFTELAPWASLVQRFGRCNRRGEQNEQAGVRWIDVPDKKAAPYDAEALRKARDTLRAIGTGPEGEPSVSLAALSGLDVESPFNHTHVIRRRDLIDLFDTTPDLAGNDIDIDRFVREVEDSDVRVFWRAWNRPKGHEPPPDDEPAPHREELCPVPISEFRKFTGKHSGQVWRWNFLERTWEKVDAAKITPGQVFLIHADAGGYSAEKGWDPKSSTRVEPLPRSPGAAGDPPDATDDDRLSRASVWQTLAQHTERVCQELDAIMAALAPDGHDSDVLRKAARWHDRGKAHEVFRAAMPDGAPDAAKVWAKAAGVWKSYGRRHFRHELAAALAVLMAPDGLIPDRHRDLIAYLVAAHHGKVRLSIRSLPNEPRPSPRTDASGRERRFARGVWDGDELPETDLGQGCDGRRIIAPRVALSLEPMEIGLCEQPPFAGQPSWAERMIRLRDTLGPFRLAYLEAILRAADWRASIAAQRPATGEQAGPVSSSAGACGKEGANG